MGLPRDNVSILIIEDDGEMRELLRRRLERLGVKTILDASGAREALALLGSTPVDVIFCDWNMPDISGLDLLKQTRASAALRNVPFVMVTAEGDKAKVFEAAQSGVTDYIVKPFTAELLESKLKLLLSPHQ